MSLGDDDEPAATRRGRVTSRAGEVVEEQAPHDPATARPDRLSRRDARRWINDARALDVPSIAVIGARELDQGEVSLPRARRDEGAPTAVQGAIEASMSTAR